MPGTPLGTARLALSPVQNSDAPFVQALLTDAQVRAYLGGALDTASAAARVTAYLHPPDGHDVWCAATAEGPVGLVFLAPHHDGTHPELSFMFARAAWGRGLAREACAAVLQARRADLAPHGVVAETQAANHAARKLLDRLGFHLMDEFDRFGAAQRLYHRPAGAPD